MLIGVDFDNTIVAYDALFHRIALERGLVPADLPVNKTAVRDHLRATGREDAWTELQGVVYGPRLGEAEPYPGVMAFFQECRRRGVPVVIISHKTLHPYRGERHDLHGAAFGWLRQHGFFAPDGANLPDDAVFLEPSKAAKLVRIATCGCTHFVDDLPEFLAEPAFPGDVSRFLFDPQRGHEPVAGCRRVASWAALQAILLRAETWHDSVAAILSRQDGPVALDHIEPLAGGANNRVYRLTRPDHADVIVKRYFRQAGDPRDRFGTERAFYRYAAATGVTHTPIALGWDSAAQLGVFTWIDGRRPDTVRAAEIDAALAFLISLNRHRVSPAGAALPPAAEACFSLDEHRATVRRRLDALTDLPVEDELDAKAREFVQDHLLPAWHEVAADLAGGPAAAAALLPAAERCVSPSDFGFHNCLHTAGHGHVFFDFEYAGWDDPAKLVGDFFCQPEVPAGRGWFEPFVFQLAAALDLPDTARFVARCRQLLPLYQLKWCCILLNEFTPVGRSRRAFSLGNRAASARRARQLARARTLLGELSVFA